LLSEEERAVRDTVRRFVDDEVMPVIGEHYLAGTFPVHLIPTMGALGLYGANLPEQYGCAGLNNVAYGLIMQELERGDSGIRSFASVQGGLVMYPIYAFGSEEQRRAWLPRLATGDAIGCFGLTEPDFGSNPGGMITTARETKTGWVLNGAKMWITSGSMAHVAIVWAKTGALDDQDSIRGFIVATDTKGFTAKDQKGKLSLRASDTSELVLQDVHVGKDALLPKSGGLKSPLMCLTQARYGIAWGGVGAAMACYDEALSYAKNRIMFDKPIAAFQLQQARLAEMLTEITKAQVLVLQLGRLKDRGTMTPQQVSLAKRNNVNIAAECAREARRLLGANGILVEYQSMRHLANIESVYTYEGTHDIHTLILGQAVTGISAFGE
jgi:glutaryl-CoA dehydrogenase